MVKRSLEAMMSKLNNPSIYALKVRYNLCFTIHHLIPIIDASSVIISCCLLSLTAARLTNYIVLSCCLFSFTATDHTMHQCMPLTSRITSGLEEVDHISLSAFSPKTD